QYLADHVAVMAGGRLVAEGTPSSIGGRDTGAARIRFRLPAGVTAQTLPVAARFDGHEATIETSEPTRTLHTLTGWALERGLELQGLTVTRRSLEDVYLDLVGQMEGP